MLTGPFASPVVEQAPVVVVAAVNSHVNSWDTVHANALQRLSNVMAADSQGNVDT